MDNLKEINDLINSFIEYRNVLIPLQETLHSVSTSFVSMRADIENLQNNFDVDTKKTLNEIYNSVSEQMKKSQTLYSGIEKFIDSTAAYTKNIENISKKITEVESKLSKINEIEKQYENQISILNDLVESKKINYDTKELQKSIENYGKNVEKVSDYINKDIAKSLKENEQKISKLTEDNREILGIISTQSKYIVDLSTQLTETNKFLKQSIQQESVNEEYIFEILDKWAESRKVKTKKK
ncbi:MAG: hypothetical protein K5765_03335 [Clostridia bacterium]|nr:hypothetical protein [Clostridia bacterium]